MSYYFNKTVSGTFDEAVVNVTAGLKRSGFGVLTQIDVQKTLREKIGAAFRPYLILGACNPDFAHLALQSEEHIGLMFPCNVVVQEKPAGEIEVSAIDPIASMRAVENEELAGIAAEVRKKLQMVIDEL